MDHKKIDEMFRHGKYDKLIKELTDEQSVTQSDEYAMFRCAQAYLLTGDEGSASRNIRKLLEQYPNGEYTQEEKDLLDAIMNNTVAAYIEKCIRQENGDQEAKDEEIPDEIEAYFENVVGMQEAKKCLRTLENVLRLSRERDAHEFVDPVAKTTHIAIAGERGSGKTLLAGIIKNFLCDQGVRAGDAQDCEPQYMMAWDLREKADVDQCDSCSDAVIVIENLEDLVLDEDLDNGKKLRILKRLEEKMEEHSEDLTFVLTGSRSAIEKMKLLVPTIDNQLFDTIELSPYTTGELLEIMELLANGEGFHIHTECADLLTQKLDTQRKMTSFMNTITMEQMLNEARKNMAQRYKLAEETLDFDNEKELVKMLATLMPDDFTENSDEQSLDELCRELDEMTGLHRVKEEVRRQVGRVRMRIKAEQAGAVRSNEHGTLHMLFLGGPGTGKTTVAELVGRIYSALGILPNGNRKINTVSRADLVSQYVGGTARLVKEACQRADGGVLFIDEAYSLVNSDHDSYGKEAVDTLIQEMENRRDSMMVIMAGYDEPMNAFLRTNPGLRSRIPNEIHFDDYSVEEMVSIFEGMIKKDRYSYHDHETVERIRHLIETKSKAPDFGNARGVRNLYEKVKSAQDERLLRQQEKGVELDSDDYDQLLAEDIAAVDEGMSKDEKTIDELLEELQSLTGLSGVKKQVVDIVNSVEYAKMMEKRNLSIGKNMGTRHLIFSGNPGTGKSTVATLLGQIYVKLGVLKKNTFVLAKRSDLVGQYVGQTAPRVANKVAEADGGILFIDEAYQLYNGDNDSFGIEAIGTLLSLVEEKRDSLMVILAGYSEDMNRFLDVNPGLRSRFPTTIEFTDYSIDELLEIFTHMCKKEGLLIGEGVNEQVSELIRKKMEKGSKEFANARGVRNLMDQIVTRQRSRIIHEMGEKKDHSDEELVTIRKEDVANG